MKSILITIVSLYCLVPICAAKVDKAVSITVGNTTRKYRLYVPNNVKENTALVFCLHGTGGSSDNKQPAFDAIADTDGIIVVYGHGENVMFPYFGNMELPGWNSTGEWSGDIDYIMAIIEDVASKYTIDRKRIYCCGFSNGGMMTYTVANLLGDVFAAYASISGYPINEFHLHHTGARPVPFLHIHGTNDDLVKSAYVSKIIDNMVARNGCNPIPETTTSSGKFTKKVYDAGEGGFPIVFYSINGMGHSPETDATEEGNASKTMWNFMKQYTLDDPCDRTLKWAPHIEQEGWSPKSHGWTINSGTTICAFGKEQNTSSNANVYPSLQFITGKYKLCFHSEGETNKTVHVKIKKLSGNKNTILEATVNVGQEVSLPFEVTDGWGEYNITFSRQNENDIISIRNIGIYSYASNASATLCARNYTRQYGEENPTFEYDVTNGVIDSGEPVLSCSATKTSPVGTYDIMIEKGSVTNSEVTLVNGTLTITPSPLTISAGNYTKIEGEENPTFTPSYNGFKNNETENVLSKLPTISTTATTNSPCGSYPVIVSGAEANNYNISYLNGTLIVVNGKCATPTITISGKKLKFSCETPGAEFTSTLTTKEQFTGDELIMDSRDITYTLTVVASAPGYADSDPATVDINIDRGDVNQDGFVNSADIQRIYSIMAEQKKR